MLEKHADFLRDFRGDTIHPSTLEVMDELGLLDDLLKLPHNKVPKLQVTGRIDARHHSPTSPSCRRATPSSR